jgi:hypothetical protein
MILELPRQLGIVGRQRVAGALGAFMSYLSPGNSSPEPG